MSVVFSSAALHFFPFLTTIFWVRLVRRSPSTASRIGPPTPLADSMSRTLQLFLPGAVREQLVGGGAGLRYLSELRRVSTLFINVRLPDEAKAAKATPQVIVAATRCSVTRAQPTPHTRPALLHR